MNMALAKTQSKSQRTRLSKNLMRKKRQKVLKEKKNKKSEDKGEKKQLRKQKERERLAKLRGKKSFKDHEVETQKAYSKKPNRMHKQSEKISNLRTRASFIASEKMYNKNPKRMHNQIKKISDLRTRKLFRVREAIVQKAYDQKLKRKKVQSVKLSKLRLHAWFLQNQRGKQAQWRKCHFDRMVERAANRRRNEIRRDDRFYRITKNRKTQLCMRRLRKETEFEIKEMRLQQMSKVIQRKQKFMRARLEKIQRNEDAIETILSFRIQCQDELTQMKGHGSKAQIAKATAYLNFISERAKVPRYVCLCCECLFFHHSVVKATEDEIVELTYERTKFQSAFIRKTCRTQHRKGKIPTLKVTNGLEFPEIPNFLANLTRLEERLVSPIVPFMQIRDLMPFALNPQLGIKGSVVNIPVSVPEMIETLPRSSNNMQTIQLKLKRNLEHRSHYMYETINPSAVAKSAMWLSEQELYVRYKIQWNFAFINDNLNNTQPQKVIIEEADEFDFHEHEKSESERESEFDDNENEPKEKDKKKREKKQINKSVSFNFDFDDDDDVLVLDMNDEIAKNTIITIAPGQSKKPLPWLNYPDLDELCNPKRFGGQTFNTNNLSSVEPIAGHAVQHEFFSWRSKSKKENCLQM